MRKNNGKKDGNIFFSIQNIKIRKFIIWGFISLVSKKRVS